MGFLSVAPLLQLRSGFFSFFFFLTIFMNVWRNFMKDYSSHSWQLDKIAFHPVHKHIVQSICVNVVGLDGWYGWYVVDLLNPKKKKTLSGLRYRPMTTRGSSC